ncbi:formyl transferase [Methylotuvimicrobium alcaliphilum]|uniref:phosphoribosylglycinamide formyltransferase 1 n=1 Tax=Methylotuvimicrobium alcaliphilum (strain DSM 19304 / NCIMB 14124 / VKM B-2133 / 20Z) TaxID=1091494 RepID=G4SYT1_META2|nr:formyl transferase [Methylotuvimicrobium alcaliphilum]CCE24378.1 putative formyl transferase [Methylotuvimicrobium alcaliphilum 20Z]
MSNLSVVILCGSSARHIYFANELCRHCQPKAIIQETGCHQILGKIIKLLKDPKKLSQKLSRWLRDRKRYSGNPEAKYYFGDKTPELERPELRIEVPYINDEQVLSIVDQHQPDVIAVFGTSLIKGPLLETGRLGIINLHGGLSPEYRGADCTFWALYNQEPEKVGCTIHYINAGIDTGHLIAHVSPEVKANDTELQLFWRAVKSSTKAFCELLNRLEKGEQFGVVQESKGKLYQVKDRKVEHEQQLTQLLNYGLLKDINLEERIEWFKKT